MRRRWIVEYDRKQKPFAGKTVVLTVALEGFGIDNQATVWYDKADGGVNCVECSGPLSAMLSHCRHANAARRAITAGQVPGL